MNRFFISLVLLITLMLAGCAKTPSPTAPKPAEADSVAELSFTFTRQGWIATNQFAVWVEDNQGRHIKTLYATNYTANGGWRRRESSLSQWVRQSGLANMSKNQIDTLTGVTPQTGIQTYRWDGTDSHNIAVQPGDYVIYLEGSLRWANRVLYRAPIQIGQGAAAAQITTEYIGKPGKEQAMISSVIVRTLR